MKRKRILITSQSKFEARKEKRTKDWVRSWLFRADEAEPDFQFTRLNPEE